MSEKADHLDFPQPVSITLLGRTFFAKSLVHLEGEVDEILNNYWFLFQRDLATVQGLESVAHWASDVKSMLDDHLNRIRDGLHKIEDDNQKSFKIAIMQFNGAVGKNIGLAGDFQLFPSASKELEFLHELTDYSWISAASAFFTLTKGHPLPDARPEVLVGVFEARRYQRDMNRFPNEVNRLISKKLAIGEDELSKHRAAAHDDLQEILKIAKRDIDSIKQGYRAEFHLRSPNTYWDLKRIAHKTYAKRLSWSILGTVAVLGTLFWTGSAYIFGKYDPLEVPIYAYGLSASIGLILIWAIRVQVKLLLSHVHLATDAAERQVLIATYLAMLKSSDTHAMEVKEQILKSIFRTANDGLIKGDTMPTVPQLTAVLKQTMGES